MLVVFAPPSPLGVAIQNKFRTGLRVFKKRLKKDYPTAPVWALSISFILVAHQRQSVDKRSMGGRGEHEVGEVGAGDAAPRVLGHRPCLVAPCMRTVGEY